MSTSAGSGSEDSTSASGVVPAAAAGGAEHQRGHRAREPEVPRHAKDHPTSGYARRRVPDDRCGLAYLVPMAGAQIHGHFLAAEVGDIAGVSGNTIGQWARWGYIPSSVS